MSHAEKPPQLSSLDEAIAVGLAQGKTVTAVAESLNVNRKTVQRHLKNPALRQRAIELRAASVERAVAMISDVLPEAAESVIADMRDKDRRRRLAAIKQLINMYCKLQGVRAVDELDDLLAQRAQLKEQSK